MFIVIILIVMEIIAVYTAIISIIVFAKEDSGIRLDRAIFGIVLSLVPFAGIWYFKYGFAINIIIIQTI